VLREGEPTFFAARQHLAHDQPWRRPNRRQCLKSSLRCRAIKTFLSNFLNFRVTDIRRYYDLWSSRGAKFITQPKVHATELRCYMRDPDGYLIEAGQIIMTAGPIDLYT
jgi:Glyoxalase/Bleomycin resistance protein/Dioxygenase superfamily